MSLLGVTNGLPENYQQPRQLDGCAGLFGLTQRAEAARSQVGAISWEGERQMGAVRQVGGARQVVQIGQAGR